MDRDVQEKVDREKEAQQVLTEQLEELVGALKASSMLVHSSLREQNKVGCIWLGVIRKGVESRFDLCRRPCSFCSVRLWVILRRVGKLLDQSVERQYFESI
jgi:hypothetical protein